MGAVNYIKRTPVPPGSGAVCLLDVTEGVDTFPVTSEIVHTGQFCADESCILLGAMDDSSAGGTLTGIIEAATSESGPWFTVANFSKAEFGVTTSDGPNTGWFESGFPALANGAPGPFYRASISAHTVTGQRVRIWFIWGQSN